MVFARSRFCTISAGFDRIEVLFTMQVPLLDLRLQYAPLKAEIMRQIEQVADSQTLVLGPQVEKLERSICEYAGAEHAIGVSSGTDAQLVLMMALGIGPGDAVVTTPYTFFATAGCVARLGARIVFADIDPATFNICPDSLAAVLQHTPNVKAIIPVHLYGCCADMARITALASAHGVPVLEDAAQALGASHPMGGAGAIAEAGWYSFYPTKNLGAFGDAGMVTCRDPKLANKIRSLRNHGMEPRYYHHAVGGNFRLDAIQAAVLNVKLPHLDAWGAGRREKASFYRSAFARSGLDQLLTLPCEPWSDSGLKNHHIYNQFIVRAPRRDDLRAFLKEAGIGSEVYYPLPLHLQECFQALGYAMGDFPESERAALETIALPIFPELTCFQQEYVVSKIADFYGA
jgi:dTDP-4-amino-4,6-dideoxygalactose transaminase